MNDKKKYCNSCKKIIFNRRTHAIYCKECIKIIIEIRKYFGAAQQRAKKLFPEYNIKYHVLVKK